jgi:hypothetical protein
MSARLRLLALVVPIAVVGILLAHAVGYRLVAPDSGERQALLAQTGHGYLAHAWLAALAVLALALGIELVLGLVHRPLATRIRCWPFLLLPPSAYLLQEHCERLLAGTTVGSTLAEPAVLAGLGLQVPFALATWLLARILLRVSEALADAWRGAAPALPARRAPSVLRPSTCSVRLERLVLLGGAGPRAPPGLAASP